MSKARGPVNQLAPKDRLLAAFTENPRRVLLTTRASGMSSSRTLERREEKVPFSDNRKLRPFLEHRSGGTRKLWAWQTRSCSRNSCGGWRPLDGSIHEGKFQNTYSWSR